MGTTNEEIYGFLEEKLREAPELQGTLAGRCLLDRQRTLALMEIVASNTSPGMSAAEFGAGTGVLGFAFLNAGGSFLHSVESKVDCYDFIKAVSRGLGFSYRTEVYHMDAMNFKPESHLDMIICEMVDTGLVEERAVPVIQKTRKYSHSGALFVPESATSKFQVIGASGEMSEQIDYDNVDFRTVTNGGVNVSKNAVITKRDVPYSIRLSTSLKFPNGIVTGAFSYLCPDMELLLKFIPGRHQENVLRDMGREPLHPGEMLNVQIGYHYGGSKSNIYLQLTSQRASGQWVAAMDFTNF